MTPISTANIKTVKGLSIGLCNVIFSKGIVTGVNSKPKRFPAPKNSPYKKPNKIAPQPQ